MLGNTPERYGPLSRALHWLSALIIFALIGVGLYMTGLDKEDPSRLGIYNLHKAFGVLSVLLLVARIVWLRLSPAPALPAALTAPEQKVVTGVRALLYVLMVLVPMSGYVMSTAGGYPVSFFGLFQLPALIGESKALAEAAHEGHELLSYALLAFVLLHAAGALKHRLKGNTEADLLKRML